MPSKNIRTICPHCSTTITCVQEMFRFETAWGGEAELPSSTPICPRCSKELPPDLKEVQQPESLTSSAVIERPDMQRPIGFGQTAVSRSRTRGWS